MRGRAWWRGTGRSATIVAGVILAIGCRSKAKTAAPREVALKPLWSVETGAIPDRGSSPAVMPDGSLVVGGLLQGPRRPCLFVISSAGQILQTVAGGESPEGSPARLWISATPWGTAYAVDEDGGFYAIYSDGRGSYRGDQRGTGLRGPLAIGADEVVYAPTSIGVRALQFGAEDSPVKWELKLRHAGTPIIAADGTLRVVDEVAIQALDAEGTLSWTRRKGFSGAVADSEGNLYGRTSAFLRAVTPEAEPKWEYEFETKLVGGPIIGTGVVYVVTEDSVLHAVRHTGTPIWSYKLPAPSHGTPAVGADGTVYLGLRSGALIAVGDDGNPKWSIKLGGSLATPALGPDGTIYVESSDRRLYAVAPPPARG